MIDKKTLPLIILLVILVVFYFQIMEFLGFYTPTKPEQPVAVDSVQTWPIPVEHPDSLPEQIQELTKPLPVMADTGMFDNLLSDTIIVNTNRFTVMLTSFGGGVVSLELTDYTYRDGTVIQMLPNAEYATPEATFAGGTFSTSRVAFKSSREPGTYDATRDTLELTYSYGVPGEGEIIKRYRFYPDGYHFDLTLEVIDPAQLGFERQYKMIWNTPLGVTEPLAETDYQAMEAVAMMSGSREKLDDFEDDLLNQSLPGYTSWGGVRSKYFAAVLIPRNRTADGVFAVGEKQKVATPSGRIEQRRITVGLDMPFASVSSLADTFTVFVGPLDYTIMSKYNVDLEDMLDIGTTPFIGWIIKPFALGIIWLLPRMHYVIPNYGAVIILFALLVKLVTLPLSMKSFKSMNAMKELQPKMEELKKKHKKNPQALNAEMMKLYKKHGVNPMSGCLPMLPQMPLFFALFSVFRSTILLRDAPFIWFISDLSRGASGLTDPYIILVVVMVATQFISQKFTMVSTTQQNKMFMYIFPFFMGWLLYKFPAGLVLYWTCFSVFSLLDYVIFKRRKKPEVTTA
ncbi:MAG: membrane protein insertase YidC [Candidatus Zixiibacteriota bacterium]|nr:MAG: membrane protein insertase YidC [candidate division Zixibacteria bacterium]